MLFFIIGSWLFVSSMQAMENRSGAVQQRIDRSGWLNVANTGCCDEQLSRYIELIRNNRSVTAIDISGNPITDTGIFALSSVMPTIPNVKYIYMQAVPTTGNGLAHFLRSLDTSRKLQKLGIKGININQNVKDLLEDLVRRRPALEISSSLDQLNQEEIDELLTGDPIIVPSGLHQESFD